MTRLYETTEFMRMTWETNRFANIRIYHSVEFPGSNPAKAVHSGLLKKTLKAPPALLKRAWQRIRKNHSESLIVA